jgi:predicted transcriptional regulator of viral defense system
MTKKPDFDQLYKIAEGQAGYFNSRQAHSAGYSRERLSDLTVRKQFIRVRRGVYRLHHFPASRFEDLFIAYLRTGTDSVISHESALAVYDLSDVLPAEIHVIMPRTGSRRRNGLQLHTNKISAEEITRREGLPVTTPARTIADMIASGVGDELVRQAIAEAIHKGLTTRTQLLEQANRRQGLVKEKIQIILEELTS